MSELTQPAKGRGGTENTGKADSKATPLSSNPHLPAPASVFSSIDEKGEPIECETAIFRCISGSPLKHSKLQISQLENENNNTVSEMRIKITSIKHPCFSYFLI